MTGWEPLDQRHDTYAPLVHVLESCLECGAVVDERNRDIHDRSHTTISPIRQETPNPNNEKRTKQND